MDAERGKSGKCSPTDKSPKVQGRKHVVIIDIVYISMDKLACLYLLRLRVCVCIYIYELYVFEILCAYAGVFKPEPPCAVVYSSVLQEVERCALPGRLRPTTLNATNSKPQILHAESPEPQTLKPFGFLAFIPAKEARSPKPLNPKP